VNDDTDVAPRCRVCGGPAPVFLDLGDSPLANALAQSPEEELVRHPLGLGQCARCHLVQNMTTLSSDELFNAGYPYRSAVSAAVRAGATSLAGEIAVRVGRGGRVLEVGCNDGTLLEALGREGLRAIGFDPASAAVDEATQRGLDAHALVVDLSSVDRVLAISGPVDAVTMSNVLAHVADPLGLLVAAGRLLVPGGTLVVEVQSWLALCELGAFDMVYHEHHCHFSLTAIANLMSLAGFGIVDARETPAQGGSLQLWCRAGVGHSVEVQRQVADEADALASAPGELCARVEAFRESALAFVDAMDGRRVVGYGASAKATTLLAASPRPLRLIAVADGSPAKQGRFLPIGGAPIVSPDDLSALSPDAVVIFAWNLVDEIMDTIDGPEIWRPIPIFERLR
jgi:SAM-dependent methyltransferase